MPIARFGFLAAWGDASPSAQPFFDLVAIPAGSFTMGYLKYEEENYECEYNEEQVAVRMTTPFAIGRTVVTQGRGGR